MLSSPLLFRQMNFNISKCPNDSIGNVVRNRVPKMPVLLVFKSEYHLVTVRSASASALKNTKNKKMTLPKNNIVVIACNNMSCPPDGRESIKVHWLQTVCFYFYLRDSIQFHIFNNKTGRFISVHVLSWQEFLQSSKCPEINIGFVPFVLVVDQCETSLFSNQPKHQWRIQDFPGGAGRVGRRQPLNLGQKPIIWQDFCRKLHENEINRTHVGGHVPGTALDPPMNTFTAFIILINLSYPSLNTFKMYMTWFLCRFWCHKILNCRI